MPGRKPSARRATECGRSTSDSHGVAHVEQVFKTEIDALRANKHNTDPNRPCDFCPMESTSACLVAQSNLSSAECAVR